MAGMQWVKLVTNLNADSKVRLIRRKANGDSMALLWVLLLCKAGEIGDNGSIYIVKDMPYSVDDLADECGMTQEIVKNALALFQRLDMIEVDEAGTIQIVNWDKYQTSGKSDARELTRERVRKYRAGLTQGNAAGNASCNVEVTHDVTQGNAACNASCNAEVTHEPQEKAKKKKDQKEKSKEIYIDIDKEKELDSTSSAIAAAVENAHARDDGDTIEAYASGNLQVLSPGNMEELQSFAEDLPDELIRYAIDTACANGIRKWAYVRAILSAWRERGIHTLGAAKAENESRARTGRSRDKPGAPENPALQYEQRTYTDDDFARLFVDLSAESEVPTG